MISMYDEARVVNATYEKVSFGKIAVVRSQLEGLELPFEDLVFTTPYMTCCANLAETCSRFDLPARALSRNFSILAMIATEWEDVDYSVFITGDTHILNTHGIEFIIDKMGKKDISVMRATGQEFHDADLTLEQLEAGMGGGRLQEKDMADFQPQLFVVNNDAIRNGLFNDIPITNHWCSEQCLGDAFLKWNKALSADDPLNDMHVFAEQAYTFRDGIIFHAS